MIKTLQKKFIVTAMAAISILLLVLLGAINFINYWSIEQETDRMLDMFSQNENQAFPDMNHREMEGPGLLSPPITEDAAMSARFFFVRMDMAGNIVYVDVSKISSVSEDDAKELAYEVYENFDDKGRISHFKYIIKSSPDGRGDTLIFLDITSHLYSIARILLLSVIIGAVCWGLMLLLVILLSKKAILPIARNIERQKQFVTDAGHEIKTPLAIIMANTEAMELYNGENKWSRNIKEQTVRLSGLMQDLLTLAKIDEGEKVFPAAEFSVSDLLEESLLAFNESILLKGAAIEKNIQKSVNINANRDSVQRVISILLDNAVKYVNDNGLITLSLIQEEKTACILVKNTCEELPDCEPEKLFDRFYRADKARNQKSGGYGIGLSSAKAITEVIGGKIEAGYENQDTIYFKFKITVSRN